MSTLEKNYVIQKRNILNEIRSNGMTMQELRFFSIYLSKINPNDVNTRVVRFKIDDFKAIMQLNSRIKIDYMKNVTNSLLCKIVNIPNERGGYEGFQLFKKCRVDIDENAEWFIEIDAHDDALPFMFEFKNRYFSYHLWNALRLRSSNQFRMYEILKQYEKVGHRILTVEELKILLGIEKDEYPRFGDFKIYVINVCQQAMLENTDIKFTYEPYGKKGQGGKILSLKFNIKKNNDYIDQLSLNSFIDEQKNVIDTDEIIIINDFLEQECREYDEELEEPERPYDKKNPYNQRLEFLSEAFNDGNGDEFTFVEVEMLNNKLREYLSPLKFSDQIYCYHYLNDRYKIMLHQDKKRKVSNRFGYVKSLIGKEI